MKVTLRCSAFDEARFRKLFRFRLFDDFGWLNKKKALAYLDQELRKEIKKGIIARTWDGSPTSMGYYDYC